MRFLLIVGRYLLFTIYHLPFRRPRHRLAPLPRDNLNAAREVFKPLNGRFTGDPTVYVLPEHLKSISAIRRIADVKYKLTELGSLLEFLLREIDQDQNPTFSLGELVFHYTPLFSEPKSISTAIGIRNMKIHGPKAGGRVYAQHEIDQAPNDLLLGVRDLLPHVPSEVADAVTREQYDLGQIIETVVKHVQTVRAEAPKQITPRPRPPISEHTRGAVSTIDSERSIDGAKVLGGIVLAGLALWGIGTLASKTPKPTDNSNQTFPLGCIVLVIFITLFFLVLAFATSTPK